MANSKVEKKGNVGRPKGLPKTGGRKPGTPNKATRAVKEIAGQYTEEAILTLAKVMQDIEAPHPARVSAANALLDRAHGKPSQSVEVNGEMTFKGLTVTVKRDG